MNDDMPIPLTIVAAITDMDYLKLVKLIDDIKESGVDADPWVTYLGDQKGAIRPSIALGIIGTVAIEAASLVQAEVEEARAATLAATRPGVAVDGYIETPEQGTRESRPVSGSDAGPEDEVF